MSISHKRIALGTLMSGMWLVKTKLGAEAATLLRKLSEAARRNGKISLILGILLFAFIWFELRPIYAYHRCDSYAAEKARNFMLQKSKLDGTSQYERRRYQEAYDAGMHLQVDYDRYFESCLNGYGVRR